MNLGEYRVGLFYDEIIFFNQEPMERAYIHCDTIFRLANPEWGTQIWNRRGCSSEILNLTHTGDNLGVAHAFCDP